MINNIDRRQFLQVSGAGAVGAMAGCLDSLGGGELPMYEQYLAVDNEQVFFVYADYEVLNDSGDGEESSGDSNIEDLDPLLAGPISGIVLVTFGVSFTLAAAGLEGLLDSQEESSLDSQATQVLLVNGTLVIIGDMDTDEITGRLTEEPESEFFGTQYEVGDEIGEYTLYTPIDGEASVFGVGENELLAAEDQNGIETVVDAIDGNGRAADEFDELTWLLETAGEGLITYGGYGPDGFEVSDSPGDGDSEPVEDSDDTLGSLNDANGVVNSISSTEETVDAKLAASFDGLDDNQRSQIETDFESDQNDVAIEFDGNRMTATATYDEATFEEATDSDSTNS